jgi:quercetin dioxygenase-like cupin family protein
MTGPGHCTRLALTVIAAALAGCRATPAPTAGGDAIVRPAISQPLPSMDGSRLKVTVVEVTYPPGGASRPHKHPCPVIGYVVTGAFRTQVQGEPEAVYQAGQSFYEAPNGVHLISANASDKELVRFLATFTCDRETPLSVAVPETAPAGEKSP